MYRIKYADISVIYKRCLVIVIFFIFEAKDSICYNIKIEHWYSVVICCIFINKDFFTQKPINSQLGHQLQENRGILWQPLQAPQVVNFVFFCNYCNSYIVLIIIIIIINRFV